MINAKREKEWFISTEQSQLRDVPVIGVELRTRPAPLARRLHQISVSVFMQLFAEFEVTPVQYAALRVVDVEPGINQTALGKLIGLDRQTISNVVQRMVEKRLLNRKDKNARSSALYTTGTGKALMGVIESQQNKMDEAILAPLSPKEREQFLQLLIKVVEGNNDLSRAPLGEFEKKDSDSSVSKAAQAGSEDLAPPPA